MNAERWRLVNDLFHAALQRDPDQRRHLLESTASTDPELAAEVRSLLAAHEGDDTFLEAPVWAAAAPWFLDDSSALAPGTLAGHYRIVRELGRGGMGVVYEAVDTRLQRPVALKSLPSRFASDPARRERLTREARAAAALSHPSIATIYAFEELDGTPFLVSELVRGDTLREELRHGPLTADRLIRTLCALASGLAAAHAAHIVHRDFKPENIIRCADGHVKILDFGLARVPEPDDATRLRLTQAGTAVGTPGYMAPEQLRGEDVDARADVFAFGVVGWELATGVHPFGANAAELVARMAGLMERGPAVPSGTPIPVPGLEIVLRRCLRADPAERYPSGEDLLRDLERLQRAGASGSGAPDVDPPSLTWWKVHQATIGVVVASMPVAVWFVRRSDPWLGSRLFLVVLALATVAVTIRLNLLFTARVHRRQLHAQRRRVRLPLISVEALLGAILLATALLADLQDAVGGVLVTLAVATVVSLAVIEPATTAASLDAGARE